MHCTAVEVEGFIMVGKPLGGHDKIASLLGKDGMRELEIPVLTHPLGSLKLARSPRVSTGLTLDTSDLKLLLCFMSIHKRPELVKGESNEP
jgi:hypothetical protein